MGEAKTKSKPDSIKYVPIDNGARMVALEVLRGLAKSNAGREAQRGLSRVIKAIDWTDEETERRDAFVDEVDAFNAKVKREGGLGDETIAQKRDVRRKDREWSDAVVEVELSVDTIRNLYDKLCAVEGMNGRQVELLDDLMETLQTAKDKPDAFTKPEADTAAVPSDGKAAAPARAPVEMP